MEWRDIISRNYEVLQRLSYDLKIDIDIEELLSKYVSIFTSYEEDRERLRIIGVKKDKGEPFQQSKKTKFVRDTLILIGKRLLKKVGTDMETIKLKAELFCKLWQQVKNVKNIQEQEELIQKNIKILEEESGESFL